MNNDPVNLKYTSQKYTKEFLWEKLEGNFRSKQNRLTPTSRYTRPTPSPRPSKNLWENKIRMSILNTAHIKFSITPEDKFQDQWKPIHQIQNTQVYNQQRNSCKKNLKKILDKAKKLSTSTISYTQPAPFSQPSTNLQGKQICMSSLDTAHIQLEITLKDKYWYQWILIQPTRSYKSTIYDTMINIKFHSKLIWNTISDENLLK